MRLWAAQTVSSFGARIAREGFAMAAILSIHAWPDQLGILAALALAPQVVVGLFAGGFVDRSSRRRIMIGADLSRTAALLTIPAAAWFHLLTMEQLYVAAAFVGGASVLFNLADHAFLPSLIDRSALVEGNTKLGITESIAEIGGPALAGTLFQLFTAPIAMLGTALTYFVSAVFLFTVPHVGEQEKSRTPRGFVADLRDGLHAVLSEPLVRPLFFVIVYAPLLGSFFSALYMIYGIKVLGLSPALMGVIIAMGGVGALFGAGLSSYLCRRLGVGGTIIFSNFVSAFLAFLIPLASGPVWLKVALMMATQLGGDAVAVAAIIPASSLRQSILPPAMLGRSAAVFSVGAGLTAIIGAFVGGWLGETYGIRPTLFLAATGMFLTPLFVLFSPLRKLASIEEAVGAPSSRPKSPETPVSAS
jgi:MFS family permease